MPQKKKEAAPKETLPPVACSSCGRVKVNQRRPSRSGQHYCSEPACQRAKAKDYYRRNLRTGSDIDAPTNCSNPDCGKTLPARKVRSNDSPWGRWCQRRACQAHKTWYENEKRAESGADALMALKAELTTRFATAMVDGSLVECTRCGEKKAVPGFQHLDIREDTYYFCTGTGQDTIIRALAERLWPEKMAYVKAHGG